MRALRLALWPAGAALGVLAELGTDLAHAIPDLVCGWTMIGCGLVAWSRRPDSHAGALLAAVGFTWFAGNFIDAALYWHRGPLVHLLVTFPGGRARSRVEQVTVAAGYAAAVVPGVWASEAATLALLAALVAVVAHGHRVAVGPERRARGAALAATGALAAVLAAGAVARLALPGGDADDGALLAYEVALCAVALALLARPWEREPLTDLVVELGETRSGSLRDALARALGDPTLEVGYWHAGGYVDAGGRPLVTDGRPVTYVERGGKPLAALVHDAAVLDDPRLVEAVASAARMAAANAELQAEVRGQVAALEASRRRLLAAGDDERRLLEQRVRVGAQRRLAELAATVTRARAVADGPVRARLDRAAALLEGTDGDLDALARGLHPRELTERGLAGALGSIAAAGPVPVALAVPDERLAPDVEAAAYFVCAEALANAAKHARATRVEVTVRREGARLRLKISDDGVGGADARDGGGLRGLADRVEAIGGALRIESPPGAGTRVIADLPL
jgi:signal transduction histidine kinase